MPRQFIRCGEEETLKRLCVRRDITNQRRISRCVEEIACGHEPSGFKFVRDIKHSFAFAHCELHFVDLAVSEFPEDIAPRYGAIKKVFSRLQRALRMPPRVN